MSLGLGGPRLLPDDPLRVAADEAVDDMLSIKSRVGRTFSEFGEDDMRAAFLAGMEFGVEFASRASGSTTWVCSDERADAEFWEWIDARRGEVLHD